MNLSIDDLHDLPKKMFDDKINSISKKTVGKLVIKEYQLCYRFMVDHHFKSLIKELDY